ncbi:zinc finger protein 665-like [Palaemon carinicauda]|uniref:zinc finger protein 665-like n=1 Tax=Palaemon carinicauda TaxID=392227 RepID=UPI0035B6229E
MNEEEGIHQIGKRNTFQKILNVLDCERGDEGKPHACHICGRSFTLKAFLKTHLLKHAPAVPYDCPVCGRVFGMKCHFINHIKNHQNEVMFGDSDDSDSLSVIATTSLVHNKISEDISCGNKNVAVGLEENRTECKGDNLPFYTVENPEESVVVEDRTDCNMSSGKFSNRSGLFVCSLCKDTFSSENSLRMHRETMTHQCRKCEKFYVSCLSRKLHEKFHDLRIICEVCNKVFTSKQSLRKHELVHAGEQKCLMCKMSFKNKRILRLHVNKKHNESKVVRCKECGQGFKRSELSQHKLVHRGEKTYRCEDCGSAFNALYKFKNHLKFHKHNKEKWKCNICGRELTTKYGLETHILTHTGERKCTLCGVKQLNEICLKRHIANVHEGKAVDKKSDKKVQCYVCGNMYVKCYMETHLKIHAGQRDIPCPQCGKKFVSKTNLREHLSSHSVAKNYRCGDCGKRFVTKKSLRIHFRKHTGETPYKCSVCSKTFVTSWTLKNHLRLHDIEKAFSCELCGKKFSQKKSLLSHYAGEVHSKEELQQLDSETLNSIGKKYVCSVCGRNCFEKTRLTLHMRTHTGERPFKCRDCSQTFRAESALKIHQKLHRKEQYECSICKRPFLRQSQAKVHELLHDGQKPHVCATCGKRFSKKSSLKVHNERHAAEQVYVCTACNRVFVTMSKYKTHLKFCSDRMDGPSPIIKCAKLKSSTMENVGVQRAEKKKEVKGLKSSFEEGVQSIECFECSSPSEDLDCLKDELVLEIDPIEF